MVVKKKYEENFNIQTCWQNFSQGGEQFKRSGLPRLKSLYIMYMERPELSNSREELSQQTSNKMKIPQQMGPCKTQLPKVNSSLQYIVPRVSSSLQE